VFHCRKLPRRRSVFHADDGAGRFDVGARIGNVEHGSVALAPVQRVSVCLPMNRALTSAPAATAATVSAPFGK
jgi:hypothetical protein